MSGELDPVTGIPLHPAIGARIVDARVGLGAPVTYEWRIMERNVQPIDPETGQGMLDGAGLPVFIKSPVVDADGKPRCFWAVVPTVVG